jgi:uncharacterized protein YcnI
MFICCACSEEETPPTVQVVTEPVVQLPEPKPEPVKEVKPPSLSIEFEFARQGKYETKVVEITEKPLGMIFKNQLPLQVECVELGASAYQKGVKPGWKFKKVAGEPVDNYVDLLNKLQEGMKPLAEPSPDPAVCMPVIFVTEDKGYSQRVCFTKRPLGLSYDKKLPLIVKKVEEGSHAEKLEVKPGWEFNSIAGKSIGSFKTEVPQSEFKQAVFEHLSNACKGLPGPDN